MAEWIETTLGKFVALQRGHDLPSSARVPGEVPVIGSGGPTGWHNEAKAKGPGITIGRAANLGAPTLVNTDFWPLNTTLYVTDFRGNNVRFVYNLFKVIDLTGFNSGSVQPMLNRNYIQNFPLAVPVLREQCAIAAVLGALDDKIAVNDRMVNTLDQITHERYRATFVHSSARRPSEEWKTGRLSDLCVTQYGYTASANPMQVGPKLLRVKDINKKNWIEWESVPYCEINSEREKYSLSTGDILVARMADPGKSAIIEESADAVFASYLVRLKTASLAHAYFVWGFLKSDTYTRYAKSSRSGSVQSNMNARVITAVELEIPPIQIIRAHLERILPIRRRMLATLKESAVLVELRDTLLPQIMSGKLRVRDAERVVEDTL